MLESTFIQSEAIARGVAPAGLARVMSVEPSRLRACRPGEYAVLAAFENDELVRDPDEGISGTDVVHIEVTGDEPEVALPQGFKVTEALAVVSPGADGLTVIAGDQAPTFEWADDSSEDGYELRVFDSFGGRARGARHCARERWRQRQLHLARRRADAWLQSISSACSASAIRRRTAMHGPISAPPKICAACSRSRAKKRASRERPRIAILGR